MSSASDSNCSPAHEESSDDFNGSDEDTGTINTQFLPYQDEPLADAGNANQNEEDHVEEHPDPDGLIADVLVSRYNGDVSVSEWVQMWTLQRCQFSGGNGVSMLS